MISINFNTLSHIKLVMANKTLPSLWVTGFLDPNKPGETFSTAISNVIKLVFIIGGFTAFVFLILGGFDIMGARGDQQKLTEGRNKITWALVGLLVLLSSWFLITLIEQIFGYCLGFSCTIDLNKFGPS